MRQAIALIGMACRYPDARSPTELWENVLAKRRAFRRMPDVRQRLADYYSPERAATDRHYCSQAALLEGYEFDRLRFRVAGSTYRSTDLTHWLALETAADALADAGFPDGEGLPRETTGVLLGNSLTGEFSRANLMRLRWPYVRRVVASALLAEEGWSEERCADFLERLERTYKTPYPPITEESLAGGLANTIAGRISNHFDLKGGGFTVDGACSSSLLAVAQAASALAAGDIDLALAGGVDLSLDPFELVGFAKNGALASEEMRVYDARSAGFWPGEGCGVVVLTRLEDALAAGQRIYAVLRGWGISSDGHGGLTRPEAEGQLLALHRAYARAGFGVETVGYFEGHGTGTAVGDATELKMLSRARREAGARRPAALGSIKANIGHTKAAAGAAGLIKAALAVDRQLLPPHTGWDEPHPELLTEPPVLRLLSRAEPWPEGVPLRSAVSAMGFGGINTHVVLEGLPTSRRTRLHAFEEGLTFSFQDAELFLLSATSREELLRQVEKLAELAAGLARAQLGDLAAELVRRLAPSRLRAAVVASHPEELARRLHLLRDWLREGAAEPSAPLLDLREGLFAAWSVAAPRIGLLFPGQGAPVRLDGGALRQRFAPVDDLYRRAALPAGADGVDTAVAQPAIVTASIAGLRVLETIGVVGSVAVGHSLGELIALHWAGALGCDGLLALAVARGRAMREHAAADGAMAAIRAGAEEVTELLAEGAVVSAVNSPYQTVVSGTTGAVATTCARARRRSLEAHELKVSHAFHSPLVAAALSPLDQYLSTVRFGTVQKPVASTVTGALLSPGEDLSQLVLDQLTRPVRFVDAVAAAGEVDLWIEVGPGHALSQLVADLGVDRAVAIDAGGPSIGGTLRAVGAAFALGAYIHPRMLFAGRFTRPLDLHHRARFLESPCEWGSVPEGLSPAPVRRAEEEPLEEPAEPVAVPGLAVPGPSAPALSAQDILHVVRGLVARRAELPIEAIRESSRMLSDLHLSSISVGQIVTEASRHLGLSAPAAPTEFADATLAQISEALDHLAKASEGGDVAVERAPAGVDAWVRAFTVELVERPLPRAVSAKPGGEARWQVLSTPDHPLAGALEETFAGLGHGPGVVLCLPAQVGEEHFPLFQESIAAVVAHGRRGTFVVVQEEGGGGFARTLHQEMPEVDTRICEVPFHHPRAAEWVAAEALAAGAYREARYDAEGTRWEPVLRQVSEVAAEPFSLGADDVLLVTGGGKGIAAECALALARDKDLQLVLLGRSRPEEDAELAANLERMTEAEVTWRYFSADVTDAAAVARAVREAEQELGPITAFLHGAGVNVPKLLVHLDEEAFQRTLSPKLRGAENVLAALDPQRLRLFVAFGSIIARSGMRGEADYALANEWLARRVERYHKEHPGCRCLTLEWSVWSGVGMGERLGRVEALVREGITPISADAGVRIFLELLEHPPMSPAVVVTGRFGEAPSLKMERPELPMQRFLEDPRIFYPGIELVVDTEVSAESDPYLLDHVYRGERLLPAVMGLEAMAQVASVLAATRRLPVFENVELTRLVAVPEGESVTLRLAALRRPSNVGLAARNGSGGAQIDVALRSSLTGFAVDHFRATCRFPQEGEEAVLSRAARLFESYEGEVLPLRPEEDLYGGILFHSGRFRRVSGYRRLKARECVAEISAPEPTRWFGTYLPAESLLGDPSARDAALHGIQASIPHGTILPVGVERVVAGRLDASPRMLAARERWRDGRDFVYDLEITDATGRLCERWEGLRLRAVDELSQPPAWASPLLGPYVERRLEELVPGSGVAVALERHAGHGNGRREASDRTLRTLLGPAASIRRRSDGKPLACGGREISVAHAQELVLAVAGPGLLGCDLEPVTERPDSLWKELLGEDRYRLAVAVAAAEGEAHARTVTRMWTAMECLKKAGMLRDTPLVFSSSTADGWQLYRAGGQNLVSLVTPIRELGGDAVLTILCGAAQVEDELASASPP